MKALGRPNPRDGVKVLKTRQMLPRARSTERSGIQNEVSSEARIPIWSRPLSNKSGGQKKGS